MKKRAILIALATLVPLAGCVAPYPYYRYSYYDRGYAGDSYANGGRYGYNSDDSYYAYGRGNPYRYYSAPRGYGYQYYGYDD